MNKNKTIVIGDKETREETKEESELFFSNQSFVHFIGMLNPPRPGVQLCFIELEDTYFPPEADINKDFVMRLLNWEGIIWGIVSIPKTEIDLMEEVAEKNGLRLINGIPCMFTQEGMELFPIKGIEKDIGRVFTLENIPSHPIYADNSREINKILAKEKAESERIFSETEKRIKQKNLKLHG